jgi:uncharacterized membrane protein
MRYALPLLIALLLCACGVPPIPSCPDGGTTITYDSFGRQFLASNCNICHAADSPNRQGAPATFTFDTLDQVLSHRDRIYDRATGDRPTMPPGPGKPAASDRQQLAEWLTCAPP